MFLCFSNSHFKTKLNWLDYPHPYPFCGFPGNYGESGMEAFKDMAAKEGICIAHSGKILRSRQL